MRRGLVLLGMALAACQSGPEGTRMSEPEAGPRRAPALLSSLLHGARAGAAEATTARRHAVRGVGLRAGVFGRERAQKAGRAGTGGRPAGDPERASSVRVVVGQTDVLGAIDRRIVKRVLSRQTRALSGCVEGVAAEGTVVLELFVEYSGLVRWARVERSTLADPRVAACLAKRARGWRFPHHCLMRAFVSLHIGP